MTKKTLLPGKHFYRNVVDMKKIFWFTFSKCMYSKNGLVLTKSSTTKKNMKKRHKKVWSEFFSLYWAKNSFNQYLAKRLEMVIATERDMTKY
jgi:hypothetical protein